MVLENIQRQHATGIRSRAAAVIGTRQVFFAVVATTAVLVSVFAPISFLPSTAGVLFREFGMVLASAVIISSFVALSLVPMVAARLVKGGHLDNTPAFIAAVGSRFANGYERSLKFALSKPGIGLIVAVMFALGAGYTYTALDRELVPPEDRGVLRILASGPDGVGLTYMDRQTRQIESLVEPILESGEATSLYSITTFVDI